MARPWRIFTAAVAAAAALALTALTGTSGAAAASAGRSARITSLSPGRSLPITVALRPRDPAALAAYARAVATPGSSVYRRYLTPAQFARRFGATPDQIARVREWLRARGLRPGPVSPGGLSIRVHAAVAQLERGLAVPLARLGLPGRRAAVIATAAPRIPVGARRGIESIVGLDSVAPRPLLARAPVVPTTTPRSPRALTNALKPCPPAQSVAATDGAHTADQIASTYGFGGLYAAGDLGAGVTVAIYELEPNLPGDIAAYEACYGIHTSVQDVPVDGGAGRGTGSGEAALDIEQLIGLAPGVRVLVYQGPNSLSGAPGAGPYDTLAAIVDQDRAKVVSVSWGECEAAVGAADAQAENTLFEQAAVQGQTVVTAAGDSGSEDCEAPGQPPQTQLAVDDPASQPFVTAVGGTSLRSAGPRPTETVWNSGGMPSAGGGLLQPGAGGGGISSLWPMPPAQADAPASLGVLGPGSSGAPCATASGACREVPDVSANADPATGYVVYWSGGAQGQPSGWQAVGGTSAAGPVWAALVALADASPACGGSPLGFANPALYRAAGSAYAQDFNDVRTGENDYTGTAGGLYAARPGYDEASGLGSPNAAPLAVDLCADTLTLLDPPTRHLTERAHLQLRLRALDRPGNQIGFAASGLPPGLGLDPLTGVLSGRPERLGRYRVVVTAQDSQQASARETFTVVVGAPPRLARVTVREPGGPGAQLSLTVSAGRGAPALSSLELRLPHGLSVGSARGLTVHARGVRRVRFRAQARRGRLLLTLPRALGQLALTLGRPGLRVASGRPRSRDRLVVAVRDAAGGRIELTSRIGRVAS